MDYQVEELLPVVARLVDKYTSKESSSVSYEAARMIMGAVIYCINETSGNGGDNIPAAGTCPPAQQMYEAGYEMVVNKVYEAKEWYEAIIADFEDYGCRNYRDTILHGMPAFFQRYDCRFNPQDHLLTLDYPAMFRRKGACGVDLILEYLKGIYAEKQFLSCFERQPVTDLLESIVPEYRVLYLDNICEAVLLRVIQCAIAGSGMKQLKLGEQDHRVILSATEGKSTEDIEEIIARIITLMADSLKLDSGYFIASARDYAIRLRIISREHLVPAE